MDDVIIRSRYPRRNTRYRKRKNLGSYNQKHNNSLAITIARQLVICLLILLVVAIIKRIQVPFTKNISEKIKYVVTHNIDFTNLYNKIDEIIAKITNKEKPNLTKDSDNALQEDNNSTLADDNTSTYDANTDYKEPVVAGEMYIPDEVSMESPEINVRLIAPVNGTVSSPFGERMHPIKKTMEFHRGIDIEAKEGTQIRAALGGEVVEASEGPTYGKYIRIQHGDGIITVYAHCSKLIAEKGQTVKQGDIIAEVGDTGAAIGSHLHFELWKDGKSLNPSNYIDISKSL